MTCAVLHHFRKGSRKQPTINLGDPIRIHHRRQFATAGARTVGRGHDERGSASLWKYGKEPQRDPGEDPWSGGQGRWPRKLKAFEHLASKCRRQICKNYVYFAHSFCKSTPVKKKWVCSIGYVLIQRSKVSVIFTARPHCLQCRALAVLALSLIHI